MAVLRVTWELGEDSSAVRGVVVDYTTTPYAPIKAYDEYGKLLDLTRVIVRDVLSTRADHYVLDASLYEVFWGRRGYAVIKAVFIGMLDGLSKHKLVTIPPAAVRSFFNLPPRTGKKKIHDKVKKYVLPKIVNASIIEWNSHKYDALLLSYIGLIKLYYPEEINVAGVYRPFRAE